MKVKYFGEFYWMVCIVHLCSLIFNQMEIAALSKVMLMPLLIAAYIFRVDKRPDFTVMFALIFSWLGDILLIFTENHPSFFLLGLCSFFLAHSAYIAVFIRNGGKIVFDKICLLVVIFALANLTIMLVVLLPYLTIDLRVPVAFYASILSTLLLSSLYLREKIKKQWKMLVLGILLFILSDTLIAFRQFRTDMISFLPIVSFWIMLTYIVAQYLIVSSLSKIDPISQT